jgi:hypothetical protein
VRNDAKASGAVSKSSTSGLTGPRSKSSQVADLELPLALNAFVGNDLLDAPFRVGGVASFDGGRWRGEAQDGDRVLLAKKGRRQEEWTRGWSRR